MRRDILWVTGAIWLSGALPAHADMVGDCNQARNSQMRIYACSEIIEGSSYSEDQKAVAYRNRAVSRADAGATDAAIEDFNEAIRRRPRDVIAVAGRGSARLNRKDVEGAIDDLNAAIVLDPKSATYRISRGYAYLVKGLPDPAIEDFTRAIILNPKSASAYNHRGLAYRKKGDALAAIADYTSAISLNPAYALAYNNRGYVHESSGDKEKAIADFNKALWLDPSLTGAADGLKRLDAPPILHSETDALIREGRILVEANCSRCHAVGETGESPNPNAPPFHTLQQRHPRMTLREPLTRGIAAPHDEMPNFGPTDAEIDKIIAYINTLPVEGAR